MAGGPRLPTRRTGSLRRRRSGRLRPVTRGLRGQPLPVVAPMKPPEATRASPPRRAKTPAIAARTARIVMPVGRPAVAVGVGALGVARRRGGRGWRGRRRIRRCRCRLGGWLAAAWLRWLLLLLHGAEPSLRLAQDAPCRPAPSVMRRSIVKVSERPDVRVGGPGILERLLDPGRAHPSGADLRTMPRSTRRRKEATVTTHRHTRTRPLARHVDRRRAHLRVLPPGSRQRGDLERLPYTVKVLLENLLRGAVTQPDLVPER